MATQNEIDNLPSLSGKALESSLNSYIPSLQAELGNLSQSISRLLVLLQTWQARKYSDSLADDSNFPDKPDGTPVTANDYLEKYALSTEVLNLLITELSRKLSDIQNENLDDLIDIARNNR